MKTIPYRCCIDTLPINRNGNVKHKTETETERTPRKKQKKKFETSAFASLQRALSRLCFSRFFDGEKSPAPCRWKGRKGLWKKIGGNASARPISVFASEV